MQKHEILNDPDFKRLSRQKNRISFVLTLMELVVYFGFISLIAFNKQMLASRITENITLGIPIGIGVIIVSWIFTGIYVKWANDKYDALVERVRNKIEL